MSRNNSLRTRVSQGFTLVEMLVVMALAGIVMIPAYSFFTTTFNQYISLQAQASAFSGLASQTQRIAAVLRGTTDITTESADSIECYAYFAPSDTYVSKIKYYVSADNKQLLADVTRMTANPPQGTPIAGSLVTHVIIDNFYKIAGVNTFTYQDSAGSTLALPIADEHTIKNILITLNAPGANLSNNSHQTMTLQVSLRNRKTNL